MPYDDRGDPPTSRPTEKVTGVALGLVVYGFATQVGLPQLAAGAIAVVAAFGPLVVSNTVDYLRRNRRP